MKQILFLILFTSICWGQKFANVVEGTSCPPLVAKVDSSGILFLPNSKIHTVVSISQTPTLRLTNDSGKYLELDFGGDTLKTSGTLKLDSAGVIFFNWCFERYIGRITELKDEIAILKKAKQ